MNETLNIIANRYSCRNYNGATIEKEKLQELAKAALHAPSSRNSQPWEIKIITNKNLIDEMDKKVISDLEKREDKTGYNRIMERGGSPFYNAPCMILILIPPNSHPAASLDCGIAVQNIALAATSMGLGNVIAAMSQSPFIGEKGDYFKQKVGWDDGYEFGMGILVGYSDISGNSHSIDFNKISYIE